MSMFYVGVDPGVSGGIAVLRGTGAIVSAVNMPATPAELLIVMRQASPARAMLEAVAAFAPKGMRIGATSALTIGRGFGRLETALAAGGVPFDLVRPAVWQKAMQCLSRGDKNVTKRRALQLFPTYPVTHATADALLLAEYCRRLHTGILK